MKTSETKNPSFRSAYAAAGVNRAEGDRLVDRIARMTGKKDANVKSRVGGYASLYRHAPGKLTASSTDGVGTKLKLAFEMDAHDTVGIDLVAMSVNDLLCVGARPAFFLDYFATGKLDARIAARVIAGIVKGCEQAGAALVGGETAEMPGFYAAGEYDLAGFAVGYVDEKNLLPRDRELKPGDALIGLASSGFHSNGYSLLRKLLAEYRPGKGAPAWARTRARLANELLAPTRIYVDAVGPLLESGKIKAMAHVTGSGFLNVPRMSDRVSYQIDLPPLSERARAYQWLHAEWGMGGKIPFAELAQTFNLGIGLVMAVAPADAPSVLRALKARGERAWAIGNVRKSRPGSKKSTVNLTSAEGVVALEY